MEDDSETTEKVVENLSSMAFWLRGQFLETPDKSTAREMAVAYAQVVTALFNIKAAGALPEADPPDHEAEPGHEPDQVKQHGRGPHEQDSPDWEMEP